MAPETSRFQGPQRLKGKVHPELDPELHKPDPQILQGGKTALNSEGAHGS